MNGDETDQEMPRRSVRTKKPNWKAQENLETEAINKFWKTIHIAKDLIRTVEDSITTDTSVFVREGLFSNARHLTENLDLVYREIRTICDMVPADVRQTADKYMHILTSGSHIGSRWNIFPVKILLTKRAKQPAINTQIRQIPDNNLCVYRYKNNTRNEIPGVNPNRKPNLKTKFFFFNIPTKQHPNRKPNLNTKLLFFFNIPTKQHVPGPDAPNRGRQRVPPILRGYGTRNHGHDGNRR